MNIGLLGFGVVGGGVWELAQENRALNVKKVLVRREAPSLGKAAVQDVEAILRDTEIDTVVEVLGGLHPAYEWICRALAAGKDVVTPVEKKPSLSDAIMNNNPYWGKYCLQAVRATGGTMLSVTDEEFIRAIRELGREEGIFTEPAGAVSAAALTRLLDAPGFEQPGLTVCNLTGHGLNAPQVATGDEEYPGLVEATSAAVDKYLQEQAVSGAGRLRSAL